MIFLKIEFVEKELTYAEEHTLSCRLRDDIINTYAHSETPFVYEHYEKGKPYIANSDITYSISHTGGALVCAVSIDADDTCVPVLPKRIEKSGVYKLKTAFPCEIGVDIERIDRCRLVKRITSVSSKFFSDPERKRLSSSDDKTSEFYHIWTRKESLVKCSGEGMRAIPNTDTEALCDGFESFECTALSGEAEFALSLTVMKK